MKVFHRIRCHLIVLLVMLQCATAASPPPADFKNCGKDKKMACMVHDHECSTLPNKELTDDPSYATTSPYVALLSDKKVKDKCKRYLIITTTGDPEKVEIEFRDDTFSKNPGVTFFFNGIEILFECRNNEVKKLITNNDVTFSDSSNVQQYDRLYCKFSITDKTGSIGNFLTKNKPTAFKDSNNLNSNGIQLLGLTVDDLEFGCKWDKPLFVRGTHGHINDDEEEISLEGDVMEKRCKAPFFNRYSLSGTEWEIINDFTCAKDGTIKTTKRADHSVFELNLENGATKCTRPRCAACECKFCNTTAGPQFVPTDGNSCAMITCNNTGTMMLVTTSTSVQVHPNDTLKCKAFKKDETEWETSTWEKYGTSDEVTLVTCISEVKCTELNPVVNPLCPNTTFCDGEGCKECKNATLKNDGNSVCGADHKTYHTPKGANSDEVKSVTCDKKTGKWEKEKLDGTKGTLDTGANVYCLGNATKTNKHSDPQKGMSAGTLIACIAGAAFILIIIIFIVVFSMRNHFKKKGNREEMKSVSVTGKKSKKGKGKKGKSSSTATSEISAPAPPPCPDSLNFPIEPEPPMPPSGGPPSSGGPASAPVVGPDTGKPDKPAELIDIKLESEKIKTEKEKSTKKDPEPSVANTVTGTSFDKSGVGSVKNTKDATDTKKDKNGESARSDTGRHTKEETKKKKKPIRGKDGEMKVQLDKNGQGLTDDDDFNIDEGAKPVNADDKNKKPYKPKEDPRKKMINVTMTEDEDGKLKPRKSLF